MWAYGDPKGLEVAETAEPILITTALKRDGVLQSLPFIKSLLDRRPQNATTIIVAAENQVDSTFINDQLREQYLQESTINGVFFVNAVVDRICNKVTLLSGRPEVTTENFAKIYIENIPELTFLLGALTAGGVWETVVDLDFVKRRKKWIVNSTHLLATFAALKMKAISVKQLIENHPEEGARILYGIVEEVVRIMTFIEADGENRAARLDAELAAFGADLYTRISNFPQSPYDVITRFSGDATLHAFLEDYHRKVNEPYMKYVSASRAAPYFISLISSWIIEAAANKQWITPQAI